MTRHRHAEPARPLEPAVRKQMEARLGHDFGRVRVQEGEQPRALHARAFAVGEHVMFAPGHYTPSTTDGADLLAHELSHVVDSRHGAAPGIYRAPDTGPLPFGPERPVALGDPRSLTLGLGTLDEFAFNGSSLTDAHKAQIPELASQILAMLAPEPGGVVTVTGHTDLVGAEQSNLELGNKRALEVAVALITAGVPAPAIETASAGLSAPVVPTPNADGRNRRVEVRFGHRPIGKLGLAPQLRLGATEPQPGFGAASPSRGGPSYPDQDPGSQPGSFGPPRPPGQARAVEPKQAGPVDPGKPEPQARSASAGDFAKGISQLPDVKKLIEGAEKSLDKDVGKLTAGDKVVLGTVGGSLVAGVVAGVLSNPGVRGDALNLIDGQEIPIPGLKGVSIVPHTKGGGLGSGISVDIIKILGGGKK